MRVRVIKSVTWMDFGLEVAVQVTQYDIKITLTPFLVSDRHNMTQSNIKLFKNSCLQTSHQITCDTSDENKEQHSNMTDEQYFLTQLPRPCNQRWVNHERVKHFEQI